MAFVWAGPSYAATTASTLRQDIHKDKKEIHQGYQAMATDDQEIRALGRQRDDALRANNPAAAEKIQTQIDQKRAALKAAKAGIQKEESDIDHQRRLAAEQCAREPACAKRKRQEALTNQLNDLQRRLSSDQAAANRIRQDQADIAKIEAELKR